MNIELGMAIFFAFLGIIFILANRLGDKTEEEGKNRWFDWSELNYETIIIACFLSAFWCFIFS